MTRAAAMAIYQDWLDAVCPLFESGRYEDCLAFFDLPHRMNTLDQSFVCKTEEAMVLALRRYGDTMAEHGVARMQRVVEDARFRGPTRIEGFHVSTALRGGGPVITAFATRNRLVLRDGGWRSAEQSGAVQNTEWHIVPNDAEASFH